jgi:dienelactone hydrolase
MHYVDPLRPSSVSEPAGTLIPTTRADRYEDLVQEVQVAVPCGAQHLVAILAIPPEPQGLVVFANGGSSRRYRGAAQALHEADYATLLFDLLAQEEGMSDEPDPDGLPLLACRLIGAIDWARTLNPVSDLPVGIFGAGIAAAPALLAAARRPDQVGAVVSWGGRPDLVGDEVAEIQAPVRLVLGGSDGDVVALAERLQERLTGPSILDVMLHEDHNLPQGSALDEVAQLAADWFQQHLG